MEKPIELKQITNALNETIKEFNICESNCLTGENTKEASRAFRMKFFKHLDNE